MYVLGQIKLDFQQKNRNSIPPILKLAATLRLLAEGGYQQSVGQDYCIGMAQPTVSKVVAETLLILEKKLCAQWISFDMSEDDKKEAKKAFFLRTGFPGVIGCIDGTHIKIIRPNLNEHIFFSRKGYHSINAMIVCFPFYSIFLILL